MASSMLATLLERGDKVSIDNGKLIIQPISGKAVPKAFLDQHSHAIIIDALSLTNTTGYQYLSYSTGNYGEHKAAGISLQFIDLITGENPYTCFNVDLKRKRGSNKGKPLPKGQFSVGKRSHFYKMWLSTNLPIPASPTRFYQCMGKLKGFVFTSDTPSNEKISSNALRPLSISSKSLLTAHKNHINNAQLSHNFHTNVSHKEIPTGEKPQALETDQTTCVSNYGNKVIRKNGYKGNANPLPIALPTVPIKPHIKKWLDEQLLD